MHCVVFGPDEDIVQVHEGSGGIGEYRLDHFLEGGSQISDG